MESDFQKRILASGKTAAKYGWYANELAAAALDDFPVRTCPCGDPGKCPYSSLRNSVLSTKKHRVDFMADFTVWGGEFAADATECLRYLAYLLGRPFAEIPGCR